MTKTLMRFIGRAIADHQMINDGDRIIRGRSGGKDSLTLLHTLRRLQRHAPIHFELAALTVDPQIEGFNPEHLKSYLADLGIPYFYESQAIAEQAESQFKNNYLCSF